MGLDINFNTIGNEAFKPIQEWECERLASIDLDSTKELSRESKEIIMTAKELFPGIEAGKLYAEVEWWNFVKRMNANNGHIGAYFRKVPRLVPTTLYFIAKAKGLSDEEAMLFANAGSFMKVDEEEWKEHFGDRITIEELYYGEIELKTLEQVMVEFSESKKKLGIAKKFYGIEGFFWGDDEDTSDKEVWKKINDMISLIRRIKKESPRMVKWNGEGKVLIEYSFSW